MFPDILMHLEEEPCHRKKRMLSSVTIFEVSIWNI